MEKHKHYELIEKYIQNPSDYIIYVKVGDVWTNVTNPTWNPNNEYRLEERYLTLDWYKDETWYKNNNDNNYTYLQKYKSEMFGFYIPTGELEYKYTSSLDFENDYNIPGVYEEVTDISIIKQLFEKEAERRYGKDWMNIKIKECVFNKETLYLNKGVLSVYFYGKRIWNKNGCIFNNGEWAEIKREPDFRPFKNLEEVRPYYGCIIKSKYKKHELAITSTEVDNERLFINGYTADRLFEEFEFLDGTSFGKLVE